jgi:hypothetical protein
MPYEGEFANYRSIQRITETERVQNLLRKARVFVPEESSTRPPPKNAPATPEKLPDFIVAIDGSNAEVDVENGYPGARVGYCTVASVLLDIGKLDELDADRPVNPVEFRKTESPSTIDAALPGSNVVTRDHTSAKESFREALYETLHDLVLDDKDRIPIVETFEVLLDLKPKAEKNPLCPYDGCEEHIQIGRGVGSCACAKRRPIYSTDALRIHERFNDLGSNRECLGEVMQVWERVFLIHILRAFEKRGWLERVGRLAFFMDGPLAVFGHPAWLSTAITAELKRLNAAVRTKTGQDIILLGIEKTGEFVLHFDEIDKTQNPGEEFFAPRSYQMLTDAYIKQRIKFSDSDKRYGADTYFGRKFFYKTASGSRIVATLPFLTEEQDTLNDDDITPYPQFATACALLDKLSSCRYPNSLSPLITANAHAAIPLNLGAKVLEQLARALMKGE